MIRHSRAANVVHEVLEGHCPLIWVSDLCSAQRGHAEEWQICLAHQLRDCQFAIAAGDAIFAPRMKLLLLRTYALARRRHRLAESTRRTYRHRLERDPMPSWRARRQTRTVSDCENDTASCAPICSPSSTTPRSAPTTTAPNVNCVPPQPTARSPEVSARHGAAISSPPPVPSSPPQPDAVPTPPDHHDGPTRPTRARRRLKPRRG